MKIGERFLGEFYEGEIPLPLLVTMEDEVGDPLDLTAFTQAAKWVRRAVGASLATAAFHDVTITDAANGEVRVDWAEGYVGTPGAWLGQVWIEAPTGERPASVLYGWLTWPRISTAIPTQVP